MRVLVITRQESDFTKVLESCGAEIVRMEPKKALHTDLSSFDRYCVLVPGEFQDVRLRERLEEETAKGKRIFTEAIGSYLDVHCEPQKPINTIRSRLIYLEPETGEGIPGLVTGDLLDDESNTMYKPDALMPDTVPLLVYKDHIVAHAHTDMGPEEIKEDSKLGMWACCGGTVLMTSFQFHNYNRARFAPKAAWEKLIRYIACWLTGNEPAQLPEPVATYGTKEDLSDAAVFEKCRGQAIDKGIRWLKNFLVDNGCGGIKEGLKHDISPDGEQAVMKIIRTDCSGESAGAFKMYGYVKDCAESSEIGKNLERFIYGPMVVKGGLFDGMMRWTEQSWGVCYQDDVARAVLPSLYDCVFFGKTEYFTDIGHVLDFLVRTTSKNGTRVHRTDRIYLNESKIEELVNADTGRASAHHNAYYSAALLLAYKYGKNPQYLEVGKKGLETLMGMYPDTVREQSETQEMCRLILPLAILYDVTGEKEHRDWLYRVTEDLEKMRHSFGGYREWDTGYKAIYNRNSKGECSILTENGDPVADLLYSCNFLPMGFAYAYMVTGDEWFRELWHNIVRFFLSTQLVSDNPLTDGSWCRAFDMDLKEAYAAPHDSGWATYSSETGWTQAEILMGMMFPDMIRMARK